MPNVIHKLNDDLINKIAAGEVVERPASVVKELVENSLDAGASRIKVMIKDGGKKVIQVSDDGCGMVPEDLSLAVARHATSKIAEFDDLFKLATMGFRGEALASIASVAQVTIASSSDRSEPAEIIVEAGRIVDQRACAHPRGTTISVKYLFYQIPARLKFLKSTETETSHVFDVVQKLALSHSRVGFELYSEDKLILDLPCEQKPLDRTVSVLGESVRGALYEFERDGSGIRVSGFIGHPQISKAQRSGTFFFVNERSVNDKTLWHAVMEAHRNVLMKGRYPILVLNVLVDESSLDVNVHPQKSEIRFHQQSIVHGFVLETLRDILEKAPWTQRPATSVVESHLEARLTPQELNPALARSLSQWSDRYFGETQTAPSFAPVVEVQEGLFDAPSRLPERTPSVPNQSPYGRTAYAQMQVIGQFLATYILCESEGKLILIDQHAAHERIGFEKLLLGYQKDGIPSEPLLIPETFDLRPSDAEIFKNYLESVTRFGFEIEFFGGCTFVLKSVPTLFKGKIAIVPLVGDWIDDIKESGTLGSLQDRLNHTLATMACHAQIRAHHKLDREEMVVLLRELDDYQFTDFCPHGRPVCVYVERDEIERRFKRIV